MIYTDHENGSEKIYTIGTGTPEEGLPVKGEVGLPLIFPLITNAITEAVFRKNGMLFKMEVQRLGSHTNLIMKKSCLLQNEEAEF